MTNPLLHSFPANALVATLHLAALAIPLLVIRNSKPLTDRKAMALIFLNVFLWRIPYIFDNAPFDPDEDIILTFGLNLLRNPVIFDTIEPGSIGIVHSYIAMLVEWYRPVAAYAYCVLHLLSAAFTALVLSFLYLAAKNLLSRQAALAGTAVGLLCLAFTSSYDFTHFNNEIDSLVLLAAAIYLLARLSISARQGRLLLALFGLTLGIVPYARLQGIPIALVLAAWGFLLVYKGKLGARHKSAMILVMSGLAPTLFLLGVLAFNNLLAEFFFYYIKTNLAHSYEVSIIELNYLFITEMPWQFQSSIVLIAVMFAASFRSVTKNYIFYPVITLFISSYYSIIRPGSFYPHYYSYLTLFVLLGTSLGYHCLSNEKKRDFFIRSIFVICFASLILAQEETTKQISEAKSQTIQQSPAAKAILNLIRSPEDRLAVYGWYPVLNVETGLASATKDNHNFNMFYNRYRDEFEKLYVADLRKFKPFVFVDSKIMWCGPFIPFQEKPLLSSYIQDNYMFYKSAPGSSYYKNDLVDIYISKERLLTINAKTSR